MNKQEAIQAMREGKKVTHRHFSPDEWMTMEHGLIHLEDGVQCTPDEFWTWRTDSSWDDDYSIYVEIKALNNIHPIFTPILKSFFN